MLRFLQASFWLAVAVTLYMTLRPTVVATSLSDKTLHLATFAGLTLLAVAAFPRARWLMLAAALSGLGALIELLQPLVGRSDEIYDWIADTGGVLLALALVALLRPLVAARGRAA